MVNNSKVSQDYQLKGLQGNISLNANRYLLGVSI
jgi:hypothetical protein